MIKKLLFLYVLTVNNFIVAQEIKHFSTKDVILTIKPHICIAPRDTLSCISTIDVSWESKGVGDYCLITDFVDERLRCWQNQSSGFFKHKIVFNKNITYLITDGDTKNILATAIMKYKSLKPHRKYRKRRNRFPWSINPP